MKKPGYIHWFFFFLILVFVFGQNPLFADGKIKQKVVLLPIDNSTNNVEYAYLSAHIYEVLKVNLQLQSSIDLIHDINYPDKLSTLYAESIRDREVFEIIHTKLKAEIYITGDYYIDDERLHLTLKVIDVLSSRLKKLFIYTLPADSKMNRELEEISKKISIIVAEELPPLDRDALIQKQLSDRLLAQMDKEEKRLDTILGKQHEIQLVPFSGINLGRTVISWSKQNPLLAPPLSLEYSYFLDNNYHVRAGIEYLPFDIMLYDVVRTEVGLDLLFGFHTPSLFSFHIDSGIGLTYDYNNDSMALAVSENSPAVKVKRFSISIPLHLGLSFYVTDTFLFNFRLKNYFFTYTIELAEPDTYEYGNRSLLYTYGFSPYGYFCLSFSVGMGIRF
jgi:hypothetical protein